MTDLATAVRDRLRDGATGNLVGSAATARIHWVNRPQGGSMPVVVLQTISSVEDEDLDGDIGLATTRVQADCMAWSHAAAQALAKAVRADLLDPGEFSGIDFWRATITGPRDLGEQTDTKFVHRAVLDIILRHGAGTD